MKKLLLTLACITSLVLVTGCMKKTMPKDSDDTIVGSGAQEIQAGSTKPEKEISPSKVVQGTDMKIAADQKALWEGKKIGGAHKGTVDLLPESTISIDSDGNILDGRVVVAMLTIISTDTTGDMGDKLNTHLKSPDFFDTANHPVAVIDATSVSGSTVTANVSIKGITKVMSFPVTLTKDGDGYLMSAELNIVRKDFGIADSLLGKVALEDTFMIKLDKVAFMR